MVIALPVFYLVTFFFAVLAVWIQGALSRRSGNRCFRIARNKQIIRTRPPQGRTGSDYIGLVRQAGIDRLTALRLQAASSPHTVRHRITRCQRLHRSFLPRSCPLGSDSRILYAHIKTGMQKSIPVLLVRQAGIEPAAFTFGVCYSIP